MRALGVDRFAERRALDGVGPGEDDQVDQVADPGGRTPVGVDRLGGADLVGDVVDDGVQMQRGPLEAGEVKRRAGGVGLRRGLDQ
jgi:hypothetical protein